MLTAAGPVAQPLELRSREAGSLSETRLLTAGVLRQGSVWHWLLGSQRRRTRLPLHALLEGIVPPLSEFDVERRLMASYYARVRGQAQQVAAAVTR